MHFGLRIAIVWQHKTKLESQWLRTPVWQLSVSDTRKYVKVPPTRQPGRPGRTTKRARTVAKKTDVILGYSVQYSARAHCPWKWPDQRSISKMRSYYRIDLLREGYFWKGLNTLFISYGNLFLSYNLIRTVSSYVNSVNDRKSNEIVLYFLRKRRSITLAITFVGTKIRTNVRLAWPGLAWAWADKLHFRNQPIHLTQVCPVRLSVLCTKSGLSRFLLLSPLKSQACTRH